MRYLLIDIPETNHPRLGKQPFGLEAKVRNQELLQKGKPEIEFNIGEKYDKYGRLLAYIYTEKAYRSNY
ncbi:thermonuclease family protein [Sporosarcina sp. FSL K6-3508]|uniref:thermonuclease family protein n=1 Tax=Sporosarcina sp. FSL K6-3508 TaxID=2921557 RepID=UPI002688F536